MWRLKTCSRLAREAKKRAKVGLELGSGKDVENSFLKTLFSATFSQLHRLT